MHILPTEYICFAFDQLLSASSPLIAHARTDHPDALIHGQLGFHRKRTDLFFLHFPIEVHIRPKLTKQVDQPIR